MSKTNPSFVLFTFIFCCFQSCQKDPATGKNLSDQKLIQSARSFFEANLQHAIPPASENYRASAGKTINWADAKVMQLSNGPVVVLPVQYLKNLFVTTNFGGPKLLNLNELTHLVIYKDKKGDYHAELVTNFPDSALLKSNSQNFTGIVFVESWLGQRLHQLKFNKGGAILKYDIQAGVQTNTSPIPPISLSQTAPTTFVVNCDEIDGYNYSPSDPEDGYSWSENAGCSTLYIDDTGGVPDPGAPTSADYGALGGTGTDSPTPQIILPRGPNIIGNIQDYFKCFTNVGGTDHLYTVTVCIDQPTPGTRQAWGFQDGPSGSSAASNIFDVGHTFLIFSETYGGNTITRNVGFYPKTTVNPQYPSDQGQLNDNESSAYNISLTITIDNAQFFNMLNYASQGNNPGYLYDLNINNCTTFAISVLQAGTVSLSSRFGSWPGGSGYDPGDLGEDVRSMPLQSNMSRSTTPTSHSNFGNCN
jgi:hypothetical protein